MADHPLAPPEDRRLLDAFLKRFHLSADLPPRQLLREVATAFARLPYENLTKIIREHDAGRGDAARRRPAEVLADHWAYGTGGTCFSLTAALLHLLRSLGWEAEPILADRRYGANTHCALLVWIDGQTHLLDPGYLIVDPIPLAAQSPLHLPTAFNELVLQPKAGGDQLELATVSQGRTTHRLTFKTAPADAGEFLHAWDASFDWDMMHYPVLTRVCDDRQLYLQGDRFQVRSRSAVARQELPTAELAARIATEFGISPEIVTRALTILKRQGAQWGQALPRPDSTSAT
jgi:arylamine N-acetyltransferase